MTLWLIDEDVGAAIATARASLRTSASAAEVDAHAASRAVAAGARIARTSGRTTEIAVSGVLTKEPDFFAMLFGGGNTTYPEIQAALAQAAADASVRDVVLRIDSPGGTVDGLFEALETVRSFRDDSGKRLSVRASKATSAAYALAAMGGKITAESPASVFGSVGVAVDYMRASLWASVVNTDSPDKRPDMGTDEGRAKVRERLDAVHELFITAIASGRGVDIERVRDQFGRGAVFLAAEAKRRKMIDVAPGPVQRSQDGGAKKERAMDLETLKAEHPEVYRAAVAQGVKDERGRVSAHLKMGEASGAMGVATKAIRDGSRLTDELTAEYQAAAMTRNQQLARASDQHAVAAATSGLTTAPDRDMGDLVAERLCGGGDA